jgi:hypothetical protein
MALRKDAPVHEDPRPRVIEHTPGVVRTEVGEMTGPAYIAYTILRLGFIVLPIVVGADKFLGILTADWTKYLWSGIPQMSGIAPATFMLGVGAIEIVAGVLVALSPRHFAWLVAAWLGLIIVNLVLQGQWLDVAMRDFGLMLGAIALAFLARADHLAKEHPEAA